MTAPPPPPPPGSAPPPPPPAAASGLVSAPTAPSAVHAAPVDPAPTDLSTARILLVDTGDRIADGLRAAGIAATHLTDPSHLLPTVNAAPFDVVVAGPGEASAESLQRLASLRTERPDMGLVVTVNGTQPADLSTFVRARPDELVRVPVAGDELRTAIASTMARVEERRAVYARATARVVALEPPRLARVIAVTGPTGGSGKTMVALALAHLLSARSAQRIVVADLDAQFGEVSAALQLRATTSAYDVLFDDAGRRYSGRAITEHVPPALVAVPDGFEVLAAPTDPVKADAIRTDEVEVIVDALRQHCDTLVLDCATGLDERTLAALDRADHTVVVTQVDVPGIANLQSFLTTIDRLGIDDDRRTVVLNKEIPDSGVTGADVTAVLGEVGGVLPFEPLVTRALNEGRPMTAAQPDHEFSRRIAHVLRDVLPSRPDGSDEGDGGGRRRLRLGRRRS